MATRLNEIAIERALDLIDQKSVDKSQEWSFTEDDKAQILGPDNDNFKAWSEHNLILDDAFPEDDEKHYKMPWGKLGKVSRQALVDIRNKEDKKDRNQIQSIYWIVGWMLEKIDMEVDSKPRGFSCDSVGNIDKYEMTKEGFMKAHVRMSAVGVADYDGGLKKAKLPEELFAVDTLNSFRGMPVVNEHPQKNGKYFFVDSSNYSQLEKGNVSEPEQDGIFATGLMTIRDKELIRDVIGGKTGVSLGYWRQDDIQNGEIDGKPYNCIQRDIRGNHLAITNYPRLGDRVGIDIDSEGNQIKREDNNMKIKWVKEVDGQAASNPKTMTLHLINDSDIQVDSDIHAEVTAHKKKAEDVQKELDTANADIEKLKKKVEDKKDVDSSVQVELDAEKVKSIAIQKDFDTFKQDFDSAVAKASEERIEIVATAKLFDVDCDKKSVIDIKREIVSASTLEMDGSKLAEIEVDAYFNAAMSMKKKDNENKVENNNIDNDHDERMKALKEAGVEVM